MNPSITTALIVAIGWLISLCLHEFGHAATAYLGGDTSVKDKGYLTMNPLRYSDPGLTLILPLLILMIGGIALPGAAVYIDQSKLRNRLWRSLVSLAGPLANSLCLFGLALALPLLPAEGVFLQFVPGLALLALLQTIAILLNSLPVPPLDGYGVVQPWLPTKLRAAANRFARFGIWIIFAALWFLPPVNDALWLTAFSIDSWLGIPLQAAQIGYKQFQSQKLLLAGIILLVMVAARRASSQEKP